MLKFFLQYPVGSSINGNQVDFFHEHGRMGKYLKLRNDVGAGMKYDNMTLELFVPC